MAFSIKQIESILSSHNIPLEDLNKCAEEICARHKADIDSIKEERDSFKEQAKTLDEVKKELDDLKKEDYKTKYETEKKAHDQLKADNESREEYAKKEKAFSEFLKSNGYSEKGAAKIAKYGGYIANLKLSEEGKIEKPDDLAKKVSDEWGEYKAKVVVEGTEFKNPPKGDDTKATKVSRGAELEAKYHADRYGANETKGE